MGISWSSVAGIAAGGWSSLAGAAFSGGLSYLGGEQANNASAHQAFLNRDFQERMSRTAHQREVADLRRAGLNPILSGTGGAGASTPSGSMATQSDVITPAVSSAMALRRQNQELKNMKAQERVAKLDADRQEPYSRWAPRQALEEVYQKAYERERISNEGTAAEYRMGIARNEFLRDSGYLPGDMDAGKVHSSRAAAIRRRSDLGAGGVEAWKRALLPWGGYGSSARSNSRPQIRSIRREPYISPRALQ